jgi:hypothetical protein
LWRGCPPCPTSFFIVAYIAYCFVPGTIANKTLKENDHAMAEDVSDYDEEEDFPEVQLDELLDSLNLDDGPDVDDEDMMTD